MKRREFIALVGGAAVTWPFAASAQQSERMRRIGVLMPFSADDPAGKRELAAFAQQLQGFGWTDSRNLQIDYRWSSGDIQKMQTYAKELIALQPDTIFCRSTPVTAALLKNTRSIPIVFAVVSDPVGEGFVASVSHPGGNATGFTNAESSLTGKWLGLLKEVSPMINRIGFIFDPKLAPGGGVYYTNLVKSAAASSGVISTAMPVHDAVDIERVFDSFARIPNGGLVVLPDEPSSRAHHCSS